MVWFKRVGLFLAVNALVVITISFILNILGIKPYITAYGINYQSLIVYCLIWGMGGAFISLALSRVMAKWMMNVQVIPSETQNPQLQELIQTVYSLSRQAQLPVMPEVGVYESSEVNAFATGPSKSRALVAVSTGLLQRLKKEEVRGVLGHEVAHIANGDMVTMTLIQGIVNAFVMFLARAIAFGLTMSRDQEGDQAKGTPMSYYVVQFALEIMFMILGSMVVSWFSRYREYRADEGGAQIAGRENMIQALEGLQRSLSLTDVDAPTNSSIQAMQISGRPHKLMKLFSSHPPLEERIARLKRF